MEQQDQGACSEQSWQNDGRAEIGAGRNEQRAEKIGKKRIGERHARKRGVLGRQVIVRGETRDHSKMEGQIPKIVQDACPNAVWADDHRCG